MISIGLAPQADVDVASTATDRENHDTAVCFSLCGTWVSIYNMTDPVRCAGTWTMPPQYLSESNMPQVVYPQRPISSKLWGSQTVVLHSSNEEGKFKLRVTETGSLTAKIILDQPLPGNLDDIVPVIILDGQQSPNILLVFLCHDRNPEIMILPETWDQVFGRVQKTSENVRKKLVQNTELDLNQDLPGASDDFYQMLSIQRQRYELITEPKLLKPQLDITQNKIQP